MLKVLAYSFIFSIIIRIVNRQGNRKRPVSRRFIKILMVNFDFLHRFMLRYIFHNFIQSDTLLYSCDYGAGLSGAPGEAVATVITWPNDSPGSRVFTSSDELTDLNCEILY